MNSPARCERCGGQMITDYEPTCLVCGWVFYEPDDLAAAQECADKMHTRRAEHRREIADNWTRQKYR